MNNNRSITTNKRYKLGVTDYYHRLKTNKNFNQLVRVTLGKKNKYYCSGLYYMSDPARPDNCLGYLESRWLVDESNRSLRNNQEDLKLFGIAVGKKINDCLSELLLEKRMLILDLGRRKKLCFTKFLQGIFIGLDPRFTDNFRVSSDLRSSMNLGGNTYNPIFKTRGGKSKAFS